MSWGGDWMCGACQHINFKKRESCQRCGLSMCGGQIDSSTYGYSSSANRSEVLAGDWYCPAINCGTHNYASRTSCFRCGAQRLDCTHGVNNAMSSSAGYGSDANLPGWKPGDWICTRAGCGVHNYACRIECFRCKTSKDFRGV